jgi:6-phosphofructokinase 1
MEGTGSSARFTNKKIAVLQAGGPTAVLNGSLFGLLSEIKRLDGSMAVYGIQQGLMGLVNNRMFQLDNQQSYDWLKVQPGAALGSGRMAVSPEQLETGINHLKKADIHTVALLGGNGTMLAGSSLLDIAQHMGYELQVIGIPKTVDNDIVGTDHTPGFPSAANFVAHAVRDLAADLKAMRNFEQVRIIETMGRNVGWLTAASTFFKEKAEDAPHLVYIPETAFDLPGMLSAVSDVQAKIGYCVIVVSEGLRQDKGRPFAMRGINKAGSGQGGMALGGVGAVLAETVGRELGLACRYENLGMIQRCASFAVSETDRTEAILLGARAAQHIKDGNNGLMVAIDRLSDQPYDWTIKSIPLNQAAGSERELDSRFVSSAGFIDPSYRQWLLPFISGTQSSSPGTYSSFTEMERHA